MVPIGLLRYQEPFFDELSDDRDAARGDLIRLHVQAGGKVGDQFGNGPPAVTAGKNRADQPIDVAGELVSSDLLESCALYGPAAVFRLERMLEPVVRREQEGLIEEILFSGQFLKKVLCCKDPLNLGTA